MQDIKLGLALGGGAFRGLAHIGVLQALQGAGIKIDMVAGTSMGALIGSIFCAGADMRMLEKIACTIDDKRLYDVVVPKKGLLRGRRAQELVMTLTRNIGFDELKIPFVAIACDLADGSQVIIDHGKLHEAVRASISLPGVFEPYELDGRTLVDGGLVNRMPDDVARDMGADVVIGVDVAFRGQHLPVYGIAEIMLRAFDISQWEVAKSQSQSADILLSPACASLDASTLADAEKCIEAGRKCGEAALSEIQRIVKIARNRIKEKGSVGKLPRVCIDGEKIEASEMVSV